MLRLYDFECPECGVVLEALVEKREFQSCPDCGYRMTKLPPVIRINMGVGAYGMYDETLGKYVGTNKEWREECIRQGVTPKGDTPKPRDLHYKDLSL